MVKNEKVIKVKKCQKKCPIHKGAGILKKAKTFLNEGTKRKKNYMNDLKSRNKNIKSGGSSWCKN